MDTAALFDLDDTLIDLQYSRRCGLRALQEILPELKRVPLEKLELAHDEELNTNYLGTLDGSLSDEEACLEHMRAICRRYGLETDRAADAAKAYRREQMSNPRLVPGVEELLKALRGRTKIGVVSNGCSEHQWDKLEFFDLLPLDAVAISEEVGARKPAPEIFRYAFAELDVRRAVMIGDSWEHDVLGAIGAGMNAIWLNRYGRTCPAPSRAVEISGFEPVDRIRETVLASLRQTQGE